MTLRIGVLGAARISGRALVEPAAAHPEVEVVAVAARDAERARAFADEHGIPHVLGSYDELVDSDEVDAVYNPLPNGLHGTWSIRALRAGKHVLCEKPFAANADEARAVAEAADRAGRLAVEAMHYRYHGLTRRMVELLAEGAVGEVRRIETSFLATLPADDAVRWSPDLAGGAMMDLGCYAVHLARTLGGAEPTVLDAMARQDAPGVDSQLAAELEFPGGASARIEGSMVAPHRISRGMVTGTEGTLEVINPFGPHHGFELWLTDGHGRRAIDVPQTPTTFEAQLDAFVEGVLHGRPVKTDAVDAVANLEVIDACYRAAGMEPRVPSA